MSAFDVVRSFEERVAEYCGAKYGVAVASCTDALFLSFVYRGVRNVILPAQTYISVPAAAIHAGARVEFRHFEWSGAYKICPDIWDSAGRFTRWCYQEGLYCVSFHAKKILPIGRGGMILTDDLNAYQWFRKARIDGRAECALKDDDIEFLGWNCYMTPEQASRGLWLMEAMPDKVPDRFTYKDYPDLSKMKVFNVVA